MTELLFLCLLVVIAVLGNVRGRLKRAEQRLAALEAREAAAKDGAANYAAAPAPVAPPPDSAVPEQASAPAPEPLADAGSPERRDPEIEPASAPEGAAQPAMASDRVAEPAVVSAPLAEDRADAGPARPGKARTASPPRPAFSFEDFFGRRLPIWAGGITLAVAGVLIVNYALAAGLLTPWVQVAGALMFGFGLLAGAEAAARNAIRVGDPRVAQALAGAGLATLYAAAFVAGNVHGLIGPLTTFAAMAAVTGAALALAARFGAPTALLALAGGFATPALVESAEPNIPLLAGYLALTVAGLTAVGRGQRWAWLGLATLAGGGLWTLALIASGALDVASTLSVGLLVIALAVAVPLLGHMGSRDWLVRQLALLAGLAQLGALVASGGYALTTWGLYLLLAVAGQGLAWREPGLALIPRLSAGLAAALLFLWPEPSAGDYALVGLAMLAVHALPAHLRLWRQGGRAAAADVSALALATFLLPWWRYYAAPGFADGTLGPAWPVAWVTLGAAAVSGLGLVTGWRSAERQGDMRYVQLATVSAALIAAAGALGLAHWALPLVFAGLALLLLLGGEQAGDRRFEPVATLFGCTGFLALLISAEPAFAELERLIGAGEGHPDGLALLRWGGVTAALGTIGWRARQVQHSAVAQLVATMAGYGALAQILPDRALQFAPALGLIGLALWTRAAAWPRLAPAVAVMLAALIGWALPVLAQWAVPALESLGGQPLIVDAFFPNAGMLAQRLLVPAILLGAACWLFGGRVGRALLGGMAGIAGVLALVALHGLYRHGFAAAWPGDFILTGIPQRLLWEALLTGAAWGVARFAGAAAWRKAAVTGLAGTALAHAIWYGLIVHHPLWAEQAVGGLPLLNWLIPLHLLPAIAAWIALREHDFVAKAIDPVVQVGAMLLTALLGLSLLRQIFAGSLLMATPVGQSEEVLRSLLAILLAVGFLLWGARMRRRDWRIASLLLMLAAVAKVFLFDAAGLEGLARIASFVALGFSLIGIGWFYARQLRSERPVAEGAGEAAQGEDAGSRLQP